MFNYLISRVITSISSTNNTITICRELRKSTVRFHCNCSCYKCVIDCNCSVHFHLILFFLNNYFDTNNENLYKIRCDAVKNSRVLCYLSFRNFLLPVNGIMSPDGDRMEYTMVSIQCTSDLPKRAHAWSLWPRLAAGVGKSYHLAPA